MKYLLLIIFACLLWNCTGKKPSSNVSDEQTVFQIDKVDEQTGLQRMQSSQFSDVIEAEISINFISNVRQPTLYLM